MGSRMSPEWWREYRARRKAQGRPVDQTRDRRRAARAPEDRSREYAKRGSRAIPGLPRLFPDIDRGSRVSFWADQLRMDLRQEAALARLEKRNAVKAVRAYAEREWEWERATTWLPPDDVSSDTDGSSGPGVA